MKRTFVLAILDGWGVGKTDESNSIYAAKPATVNFIERNFPNGSLQASGISVGLPWDETGNSEVGHLTLGAGKILYQHLPRISLAIQDKTFFKNQALKEACDHTKTNHSAIHLLGLVTNANIHSSFAHLEAIIQMLVEEKTAPIYIHVFTDGRDTSKEEAEIILKKLESVIQKNKNILIASLMGRHYAMNRDNNWDRTKLAYTLLTKGGATFPTWHEALEHTYARGLSDEFVEPTLVGAPHTIKDNDALIFFNFREDSMRQLTRSFADPLFDTFPTAQLKNVFIVTMTNYEDALPVAVAFPKETVNEPLGKVLADHGKTQLRIAEAEKYAHVTYFFNGLREAPFPNEYRVLIPSQNVAHVEEHPEMHAAAVTDRALVALHDNEFDFILLNYANADIIAHTGNSEATVKAVQTIDHELERLLPAVLSGNHILLLTSDHGNAEAIINLKTGRSETAHNPNPVPFYLISNEFKFDAPKTPRHTTASIGILSDVAPTLLALMGLPKPQEMTGESLLEGLSY